MLKKIVISPYFLRSFHTNATVFVRKQLGMRKRQNPGIDLRASLLRQGENMDLSMFEEDPGNAFFACKNPILLKILQNMSQIRIFSTCTSHTNNTKGKC